ncbi:hypothetical protein LTS15_005669 [Exophiala xenobiotica]|nr:hypothetical protein LTS15_005669 [Exophiala xenobiotica]
MVLAVGNVHAFRALKEAITFFQRRQTTWSANLFSNDPKVLVSEMATLENAGNFNSYLGRFALARLAKLHLETVANGSQLAPDASKTSVAAPRRVTKAHNAHAYRSMIEHIWGLPFPSQYRHTGMNKRGLIDDDSSGAVQWNKCKGKLRKQVGAGHRWLDFAQRFGWFTLGLITREWHIREDSVKASDRT